jgi:hypothetical protein
MMNSIVSACLGLLIGMTADAPARNALGQSPPRAVGRQFELTADSAERREPELSARVSFAFGNQLTLQFVYGVYDQHEVFAPLRQAILDPGWHLGIRLTLEKPETRWPSNAIVEDLCGEPVDLYRHQVIAGAGRPSCEKRDDSKTRHATVPRVQALTRSRVPRWTTASKLRTLTQ